MLLKLKNITILLMTIFVVIFSSSVSGEYDYYKNLPLYVSSRGIISIDNTQDINKFISLNTENHPLISSQRQDDYYHAFLKRFFSPWNIPMSYLYTESLRRAMQGNIAGYSRALGYGENYHQNTRAWFDAIVANMNANRFPDHDEKAIAIDNAYVRLFPTNAPHFGAQHDAGSGYPFDDFQTSVVWAGTPVRVLHLSTDGSWAFVMTPSVTGWVTTSALASVSLEFQKKWESSNFVAIIKRETAMKDLNGHYHFDAYMGSVLPLSATTKTGYQVLVPGKDIDNEAKYVEGALSTDEAVAMPWASTPLHFSMVIKELLGEPYGWGGIYFYTDCSSSIKSLYTPFGIWLPRNSSAQALFSRNVSLEELTPVERRDEILKRGVPFTTLISVKGHIMMYIGQYKGDVMTFQNVWAFATMSRKGIIGRDVIGRAVLMPLQLSYGKTGIFPQIDGEDLRMTFF